MDETKAKGRISPADRPVIDATRDGEFGGTIDYKAAQEPTGSAMWLVLAAAVVGGFMLFGGSPGGKRKSKRKR